MKKILITTIMVLGVLLLSATALPVSAGVEPSPFKSKTVINRIHAAQNQLGPIQSMLDHIKEKPSEFDQKGSIMWVTHKVDALPRLATYSLRTLESAEAMFQDCEPVEINDYSEALEELEKYAEALQDEVLGLEENSNLPKRAIMSLRQLGIIVDEILTVVDEFLGDIYIVD